MFEHPFPGQIITVGTLDAAVVLMVTADYDNNNMLCQFQNPTKGIRNARKENSCVARFPLLVRPTVRRHVD
jgi:hypothetical protein